MIEIKNVSMKFDLGIEKGISLKETFINFFSFNKPKKKKEYFDALKNISFHVDKGEVIG